MVRDRGGVALLRVAPAVEARLLGRRRHGLERRPARRAGARPSTARVGAARPAGGRAARARRRCRPRGRGRRRRRPARSRARPAPARCGAARRGSGSPAWPARPPARAGCRRTPRSRSAGRARGAVRGALRVAGVMPRQCCPGARQKSTALRVGDPAGGPARTPRANGRGRACAAARRAGAATRSRRRRPRRARCRRRARRGTPAPSVVASITGETSTGFAARRRRAPARTSGSRVMPAVDAQTRDGDARVGLGRLDEVGAAVGDAFEHRPHDLRTAGAAREPEQRCRGRRSPTPGCRGRAARARTTTSPVSSHC